MGRHIILWHTLTHGIHDPQILLGISKPLFGGAAVPFDGLGIILRYTFAFVVHAPQIVLGGGVSLFGKRSPFGKGGRIISGAIGRHAFVEITCNGG